MLIEYHKNDKYLNAVWEQIYDSNEQLSIYQSKEFNDIKKRSFKFRIKKLLKIKTHFFIYYRNELPQKPLCIIPLEIYKNEIRFYGDGEGGFFDFIYVKEIEEDDFKNIFRNLAEMFKGKCIILNRLHEESKLCRFMLKEYPFEIARVCTRILLPASYDLYYAGLSKNSKKKLRRIYNKIIVDGIRSKIMVDYDNINKNLLYNHMDIYWQRYSEKNCCKKIGFVNKLTKLYTDYTYLITDKSSRSIVFTLYYNNKIAAFFHGVITNYNSIIITRSAMNSSFYEYSPGKMLINEAIKYIYEHYPSIKVFDMTFGDEEYKAEMGGTFYNAYKFEMVL